ncbi:hypothetical protein JZ751_006683 [Albula glossodonta]|uniref:DH domain-containing protein n=1 Tax=Albula glossodonta TaxID=121402 RepID=A0A8T2P9S0_9TELE|nr:hypothetical protein JZ751_006683 [Albula glossodonta]
MEVYEEAVDYLQTYEREMEPDLLEDVFEVDFASCSLHADSIDLPDTPTGWTPEVMLEKRLPVLSSQQVQTVFFQVPELRDLHQEFYTALKARLQPAQSQEPDAQLQHRDKQPAPVGDLFLRMVSQLGVYRGFIDNYESAVEIVRKCTQSDQRFRTLAEDLLKHTPQEHQDHALLQEALRISSSFLSGVNEESHCKRAVTLSTGMRRQLMRDGFVVDMYEGGRSIRHLFLYTDLLLCAKMKGGTAGKQVSYRFSWYLPLAGLKLHWGLEQEQSADLQSRVSTMRGKMFHLRQELKQQRKGGKGYRTLDRSRRKLQQIELWLLTHSPVLPLELHSPNGKNHTLVFSALYELEEWREAIEKLIGEKCEDRSVCGTLSVAVHSACGLPQPASLYVCLEVDGYKFYDNKAQTRLSLSSLTPQWDEVDGAQCLSVLCVQQTEGGKSRREDKVQGRSSIQLDPSVILKKWKRWTVSMNHTEVHLSLKYLPHPLEPPSTAPVQHQPVFNVPIGVLAQQEGVLVPHIVRSCTEDVERRGLEELYFRELPEPLIPRDHFRSLADALGRWQRNKK